MPAAIPGLPATILWNWSAAFVYALAAVLAFGAYLAERSELNRAALVFLASMAFALGFTGAAEYTGNALLRYAVMVTVFLGAVFLLRLPISAIPYPVRQVVRGAVIALSAGVVVATLALPALRPMLPKITMWYMIAVNGVMVGLYLFAIGLKSKTTWVRVQAAGMGVGLVFASLASPVAAAAGAPASLSAAFHMLAPVISAFAIGSGRYVRHHAAQ